MVVVDQLTFVVERKHRSDAEYVSSEVNLSLPRVYYDERKHAVKHLSGLFGTETNVEVDDGLPIAVRFIVKSILLPDFATVIDLSVVDQPYVGVRVDPHRLHAVNGVHDLKTVESETGVGKAGDGFDTECLWTPVGDLVTSGTSHLHVVLSAEQSPDATHLLLDLVDSATQH